MHKYKGAIVAHIGPMFGGKTSGLLADVRKMTIAKYNVALFKPKKDDRYAENKVVNHDGESINAINIVTFQDIIDYVESNPNTNVVAIDEFQFIKNCYDNHHKDFIAGKINASKWKDGILNVDEFVKWIMRNQKALIISGLDLDSELKPFSNTKDILPYATHIFKHKAVCVDCGSDATTSYCTINKNSQELVGGHDIYIPLCIHCYNKRKNGDKNES